GLSGAGKPATPAGPNNQSGIATPGCLTNGVNNSGRSFSSILFLSLSPEGDHKGSPMRTNFRVERRLVRTQPPRLTAGVNPIGVNLRREARAGASPAQEASSEGGGNRTIGDGLRRGGGGVVRGGDPRSSPARATTRVP